MTKLNDADAIYIGSEPVLRVLLGRTEIWTPPGAEVEATLGDTGTGGGGNWPTSADRALLRKITLPHDATVTLFRMALRSTSVGVGDRFKGLIYAADNTGGYPGTRLLVTDPTSPTSGGAQVLTVPVADIAVPAQEVWIGYVCDGGSGAGSETDSGGTLTNGTIMLNGGEVEYASPPATAGLWPGSPGPYSNLPSLSFDYLYTP